MSSGDGIDSYQLQAAQVYTTSIIGPPIVGWSVAILLCGAVWQAYLSYVQTELYRKDPRWTKAVLHAVVLLATTQTACSFWLVFHYGTWQQRDSATLYSQTSIDCLVLTFVGIEGAIVQLYLAHRATLFMGRSKWRFLYWACVVLGILVGLAGAQLYLVASVQSRAGVSIDDGLFNWAVGAWLWGCSTTDCLITVTLIVSLRKKMSQFSARTDSILAQLIALAIQSALPTALFSLAGAVLAYTFSVDSLYANVTGSFWAPLTGLYALSLLATLSGRRKVREVADRTVSYHLNLTEAGASGKAGSGMAVGASGVRSGAGRAGQGQGQGGGGAVEV